MSEHRDGYATATRPAGLGSGFPKDWYADGGPPSEVRGLAAREGWIRGWLAIGAAMTAAGRRPKWYGGPAELRTQPLTGREAQALLRRKA